SGIEPDKTTLLQRPVLPRIGVGVSKLRIALLRRAQLRPLLALWRHLGKAAVGRVDDQRRAPRAEDLVAAVVPELVVRNIASRRVNQPANPTIDQVAVLALIFFLLKVCRFLFSEKLLRPKRYGPLHRRDRAVVPHSL